MRIHFAFLIGCLPLVLLNQPTLSGQSTPPDRSADAAAIRAEIEKISQAFVDKDLKTLEATHGKDWRGFTPWSGHVIRGVDGYMNEATFEPGTPKGQGMVGFKISDFDVVFYGDVGVASFVMDLDVVNGTQKGTQKLTLVDVFHKGPKGWIQVASNTSLHPDEIGHLMSQRRQMGTSDRAAVLKAREAVWRAWFAGDVDALSKLVPPELITIEPDSDTFGTHTSNLEGSRDFARSGAKLTRLEFPRTEFQAYGNTVILYTTYELDLTKDGNTDTQRGVATEVFVQQNGRWLNTGWQLAPLRSSTPRLTTQSSDTGKASLSGKWGSDGKVFLELAFDGKSAVSGTAIWRHGQGLEQRSSIEDGTFDPKTAAFKLEGNTQAPNGTPARFVIEGTLERDVVRGTFRVGTETGDFEFKRMS
ncbi:MAG TPA: nuclear transport factor 2 family protein [Vicinamibacterales bacterium]|nr:nuclear transport factor 2 family protein [Vicinamibacterales bacterium]